MRYWPFILVLGIVFVGCAMMYDSDDSDAATVQGSGTYDDPFTYWSGYQGEAYNEFYRNDKYILEGSRLEILVDDRDINFIYYVTYVSPSNCGLTVQGGSATGYVNHVGTITIGMENYWIGGDEVAWSGSVKINTVSTYYHTIFYNSNGGSGFTESTTVFDTNSGNTNVPFASNGYTAPTGYYFAGWRINNTGTVYQPGNTYPVGGNGSVTAYAYWLPNLYTITWKNWDNTVLETDNNVPYGSTPSYDGPTPTRTMSIQYVYTFAGWTPTIVPITEDSTYTAQFSHSYREYTDGDWRYNILDNENAVLIGYSGIGGIVQIPNTLNGTDVSTIGDALKNDSSITGIIIPSGIAAINEGAFSGTSITEVLNLGSMDITGTSYGLNDATIYTSLPGWFYISDVEYTDRVPDNSTVSKLIRIIPLLILIGVIVMIARNRVEDE